MPRAKYATLQEFIKGRFPRSRDTSVVTRCERGQPVLNLFFAGVRFLLLKGVGHELGNIYRDAREGASPDYVSSFSCFKSFCLEYKHELKELINSRLVQTIVPGRCTYLMPVFDHVWRLSKRTPLTTIEIGSSAGLNLLWDHYRYVYSDGNQYGDPRSDVSLNCEFRGSKKPAISGELNNVFCRAGIDLSPIDLMDAEDSSWLQALVWPERGEEEGILTRAIEIARLNLHKFDLYEGDAVKVLPDILKSLPREGILCLFDTHVMNQFSPESRDELSWILTKESKNRKIYWVSIGGLSVPAEMKLTEMENGNRHEILLGYSDAHGRWMEWIR